MAKLLFLLPAILGLLLPQPAAAVNTNYLLSGESLGTEDRLRHGDYDFIMQDDCNLVFYTGDFMSNTANNGRHCKLTLNHDGQLVIKSSDGTTVWTSGSASKRGNYAAVLHPEGKVLVYGPEVWATSSAAASVDGVPLDNIPLISNVLFSGQILYNDAKLVAKNYMLVMQGDCNLVLSNGGFGRPGWQSNTQGKGKHCFLRLDHQGGLAVKDDVYKNVWSSGSKSSEGHYVLILQDDGRAVVYGPAIWSTKPQDSMVTEPPKIAKVTDQK